MKTKNLLLIAIVIFISATLPFIELKKQKNNGNKIIDITGIPYSTTYHINDSYGITAFSLTQDSTGKMIFASRKGIWTFDGLQWSFIPMTSVPFKLYTDTITNKIYVICSNSIGYLENKNAKIKFYPLINNIQIQPSQIQIVENAQQIVIYTTDFLFIINRNNPQEHKLINNSNNQYKGLIKFNNQIFVLLKNTGFYKIENQRVSTVIFYPFQTENNIILSTTLQSNKTIFATDKDSLYIFDGKKISSFFAGKENFLKNQFIYYGKNLTQKYFAVLTIKNGAIIIDKNTAKPVAIFNVNTSLPDNEITDIFLDKKNGIWLTHKYGISRYDLSIPIINYNYIGLEGRLISTLWNDSTLYVITSTGLYKLTKTYSTTTIKTITKKAQKITQQQSKLNQIQNSNYTNYINENNNTEKNAQKQNLSFFQRISNWFKRKKKKNKHQQQPKIQQDTVQKNIDTIKNNIQPQHKTIVVYKTKIKSKKSPFPFFFYKKIDGLKGTPKKIFKYKQKIFVATINGLFLIENEIAKKIYNGIIFNIYASKNFNGIFFSDKEGLKFLNLTNLKKIKTILIINKDDIKDNIISLVQQDSIIWIGTEGYVYKINIDTNLNVNNIQSISVSPIFLDPVQVIYIPKTKRILFLTSDGIYRFLPKINKINKIKDFTILKQGDIQFIRSQANIIWYNIQNKWKYITANTIDTNNLNLLNLFDNITDIKLYPNGSIFLIENYQHIYEITSKKYIRYKPKLYIQKITVDTLSFYKNNIKISYKQRGKINIYISSPSLIKQNSIKFQYRIKRTNSEETEWSGWIQKPYIELPNLSDGKYIIEIRAKNILDKTSKPLQIYINIIPPFYKTTWFTILMFILLAILSLLISYIRTKKLEEQKRILEEKVKERTEQIRKQNEELKAKNEEIKRQRDEIKKQHYYITQSINYARRIQTAMLPSDKLLSKYFSEHFILSIPKDIVSGDFYWFKEVNNKLIVAVADCTGHGVPGAFLSMLGIAFLNEILNYHPNITAANLLNTLRENIIFALQEREDNKIRDGMDIALAIFDFNQNKLNFAGAYNPLIYFRNKQLITVNADRMPIGYSILNDKPFTDHWIDIHKQDIFYLFSDGYYDQLGGKYLRKLNYGNFKKLLTIIQELPLKDQKEALISSFYDWKGDFKQIDDITILALRL